MSKAKLKPYTAQDHAWLMQQHQDLYTRNEGFDDTFGPLVDDILNGFEAKNDPTCEKGWIAWAKNHRLGSVFCVKETPEIAKLRLFLLVPEVRGKGLGQTLLQTCMSFAKDAGYLTMRLWTHESHVAACALYRKNGWTCVSSKAVTSFSVNLVEQRWEITF